MSRGNAVVGCEVVNPGAKNVRFWFPLGGRDYFQAVRLTLSPGQGVEFWYSGRHDEGWESHIERLVYDGEQVVHDWCTDGTDCDGRMSRSGTRVMVSPDGWQSEMFGVPVPTWKAVDSSQRDYAAEAAGY